MMQAARMDLPLRLLWAVVLLSALLVSAYGVAAQTSIEASLPVEGSLADDRAAIELRWPEAEPLRVGNVAVLRREFGEIGASTWRVIEPPRRPIISFVDATIQPGIAYEYQVLRYARDIVDVGYWLGGTAIPAIEFRGTALVIVDESISDLIWPRLDRFVLDLIGDGWKVIVHETARGDGRDPVGNLIRARKLRQWISERYLQDPFARHALVLIGHVPIVESGSAAPDGHAPGPHPTDLFYADVDGMWPDDRNGILLPNRVPSDFIELQVGRIDFAPLGRGNIQREVDLLNLYFDRNHHWRHGLLGDLREAYGQSNHLMVEQHGLSNIVGTSALVIGGHHDIGARQRWLWGVDFGSWDGARYEDSSIKAVFSINFGSAKQRFDRAMNPLTAMLAQPWYAIATGWGGRPAWRLHAMALGASIGDVHMRTVNNGAAEDPYRETMDYFPTGRYLWRNPIWVNLLGDPTTGAFPLRSPTNVMARRDPEGVRVSWLPPADPDVLGYKVYKVLKDGDQIIRLTDEDLISQTEYLDPTASDGGIYMVRAYGRKEVPAGSFYLYSQGAYAKVGSAPATFKAREFVTRRGQPVEIGRGLEDEEAPTFFGVIEGPDSGNLSLVSGQWIYQPPAKFIGKVELRVAVSDGLGTNVGIIQIDVLNE